MRINCLCRLTVTGIATLAAACAGERPAPPAPGHFESPLVQLKRLQGEVGHLHVDEVRFRAEDRKLFQCSYTFGVVDATNPADMTYLAENLTHTIPGDTRRPGCVHLAYDGDIVYTTHRGNLRNPAFVSGWDISANGSAPGARRRLTPKQIPVLQEPGVSYEGIDVANHVVYVALRADGLGTYRRDESTNRLVRVGTLTGLGNTWGVRVWGTTAFVTDIDGHLSLVDVSTPEKPVLLGNVAIRGVPKGLAVDRNMVYVAAGSEGIAIVNAADRTNPKVIATADTPGPALRVAYAAGHLFVAAWTDARVYDVTDPADPRLVGAVRLTTDVAYPDDGHPPVTARTKGIAAEGNDVFIGNWWVLYSYRLYHDRKAPSLRLPEEVNLLDFGQDEGGDQRVTVDVTNQGTAPLAIHDAWTTHPAFQVSPSSLTVAPGARGRLSVTYRPTGTERQTSLLHLRSDDPLQPQRSVSLVGNQTGLGIGQKFPTTEVTLLDGSEWSSDEASGKVRVLAYFATFCPVCAEHVPELERHFWKKYRDRGVEIIAVDFHDASVEGGMKGVQDYVRRFGNTHPVGLESPTTPTYSALVRNYRGANPFPVDVVVGRDGLITYISREYDPDALEAAIEAALAR